MCADLCKSVHCDCRGALLALNEDCRRAILTGTDDVSIRVPALEVNGGPVKSTSTVAWRIAVVQSCLVVPENN